MKQPSESFIKSADHSLLNLESNSKLLKSSAELNPNCEKNYLSYLNKLPNFTKNFESKNNSIVFYFLF